MSSILTNTSAMVALQTLKGINTGLEKTQNEISTGKSVNTAKDNAAIWSISKVMESDVMGFEKISGSLAMGELTVATARQAAELVTDLLQQVKGKIVDAQGKNDKDRATIQTDIAALTKQIESVVGAAQLNGLNLVDGSSNEDFKILSSLDRTSSGQVNASSITVERQNLSISSMASGATFGATANTDRTIIANGSGAVVSGTADTVASAGSTTVTIASVADGNSYRLTLDDTAGANKLGARTFEYVAGVDDSASSVAANLQNQLANFLSATGDTNYTVSRADEVLTINNGSTGALSLTATAATGGTAAANTGGLGALATVDVTTEAGATGALTTIEGLIKTSISAASALGSVQGRIETQSNFVSKLSDSLKSGIGSMVDADMEEASARLQALQVQQQLGVQALSIANQAPQSILSLFR